MQLRKTHKRPTKVESVESEDRLKAEHWVEPDREMHFWAIEVGNVVNKSTQSVVLVAALNFLRLVRGVVRSEAGYESMVTWRTSKKAVECLLINSSSSCSSPLLPSRSPKKSVKALPSRIAMRIDPVAV